MSEKVNLKESFLDVKRRLFDKAFGAKLNSEQLRATFTVKGPVLVLAGAGSGKTTVLVNRIAYIIKYGNAYFSDEMPEGVDADTVRALEYATTLPADEINDILPQFISEPCPPWAVLAFTFTNKAAGEIKERLLKTFEDKSVADSVWAGTFHSVCLKILRKYGERLGYKDNFSIYDTDDKKHIVIDVMRELGIDEKRLLPKTVCAEISFAKDRLEGPEEFDMPNDPRFRDIREIYRAYQKKLMEYNAVDFDDIIMKTVELLESDREVREYYQRKFMYVLVDEYQDTNYAQFVLTKLLSDGYRNIMVVGDDDQSIYRFRGATIENILNFDKTYPDATVVKLEQNYRSTENILAAANAVINNNDNRHSKKLWSDKGEGERITLKEAFDQNEEGRYIVEKITGGIYSGNRKYSDYAVLYRTNALGRTLQTSFTKSGIPYRIVGGMGFYEHKEVKDMVAYLTVVAGSGDNLRLKRIINEPKRKIGSQTVEAIESIASMNGMSMYSVMSSVESFPVLSKHKEKLLSFVSLIEEVKSVAKLPSEIIKEIYERSGYRDMLLEEKVIGEKKIENVEEFISAALEYEKRMTEADTEPTLIGFLEEVFLVSDVDKYDDTADTVVLMTVHGAKGLEFPIVFLAGMEEGIFPSSQNEGDPEELNEERRLAYVAITRAKEKLYVTCAKERFMYGRTTHNSLSRFIKDELPEELIERDVPKKVPPRAGGYQSSWQSQQYRRSDSVSYREMNRAPEISSRPAVKKSNASSFGVERIAPGSRVNHAIFGNGTVLSAKDMGGDVLYEVTFDNGQTKKLMATFAKLKRI